MKEKIWKTIERVSRLWGVEKEDVLGTSRKQPLPFARATIAAVLREQYGLTIMSIGEILNRNHASILYYLKLYKNEYTYNKEFHSRASGIKDLVLNIRTELQEELEDEFNEIIV